MATDQPRILIVEDHPLFRMALKTALLQFDPDVHVVEADTVSAMQAALEGRNSPRMVLLDLAMPGSCGLSALLHLRGQHPELPVIVISSQDDQQTMRRVKGCGARAFVSKASCMLRLREAVAEVMSGATWFPELDATGETDLPQPDAFEQRIAGLTPQQFRVLGMVTEGLLNKQIAWELHISEATVKAHLTAIFRKLGVRTRTQAVLAVQQLAVQQLAVDKDAGADDSADDSCAANDS